MNESPYKSITINLFLENPGNIIQFDASGNANNFGTIILKSGYQERTISITPQGKIDEIP